MPPLSSTDTFDTTVAAIDEAAQNTPIMDVLTLGPVQQTRDERISDRSSFRNSNAASMNRDLIMQTVYITSCWCRNERLFWIHIDGIIGGLISRRQCIGGGMDRDRISYKIGNKAWLIFHDDHDAQVASMAINGELKYRDGDHWVRQMQARISTSATIICREAQMGTWNIFRPREAKFLIDEPLQIHEDVDNGTVSFSADERWCQFCDHGYHPRNRCPILAEMLVSTRGRHYECFRCLAINHHHHGNCRFPVVRGAARIAEVRRQQQYNIGI